jgi:hypothetical protein
MLSLAESHLRSVTDRISEAQAVVSEAGRHSHWAIAMIRDTTESSTNKPPGFRRAYSSTSLSP